MRAPYLVILNVLACVVVSSAQQRGVLSGNTEVLPPLDLFGIPVFSGHPNDAVVQLLQNLEPSYAVLRNVDYNEANPKNPAPQYSLVDLPDGAVQATDIEDCALKCISSGACNMASWYGDSAVNPNGRNCWLKQLDLACQYPPDLEEYVDDRYLLLARPGAECASMNLIAPPAPPPSLTPAMPPDKIEETTTSITTPTDKEAILGNRQMDVGVPTVWMIESKGVLSHVQQLIIPLLIINLQIVLLHL